MFYYNTKVDGNRDYWKYTAYDICYNFNGDRMTDKPLVSILIPCYNVEGFIEKTINNIQEQTYDNLEIICVDDGSTDSTLILLGELATKDQRIKVSSQSNQGIGKTRGILSKLATGKYSIFVDSDDFMFNKKSIEYMVNKHQKNKRLCTGFNFKAFYDKWTFGLWFRYTILNIIRIMIPFIHSNPLNRNWYFWAKIFDASYLAEGLWNDLSRGEEKKFFEDNIVKIKFYRKKVYRYRVRANSAMSHNK